MGFNKPDQNALNQYRDEAQSMSSFPSPARTPLHLPSGPSHHLPLASMSRSSPHPPALSRIMRTRSDDQRSTTNTGLRTTTKSETALSSPVSKPDGTTPSQSSSPTTRSLTIWISGPSRGLVRRKYPRVLGSGNMDSERASKVVRRPEVFRWSVSCSPRFMSCADSQIPSIDHEICVGRSSVR